MISAVKGADGGPADQDVMALAKEVESRHQEGGVRRQLTGPYKAAVRWTLIASSLFNLYTTGVSALSTMDQRGLHVLFMLTPVFVMISGAPGGSKKKVTVLDLILTGLSLAASLYILLTWRSNVSMLAEVSTVDLIFGTVMILAVLEATRRSTGTPLAVTAGVFILYVLFGQYLPGILAHPPVSYKKMISFMYQTTEGIYGTPISVSSTYLVVFVLFGSVLKHTGAGQFFIDATYAYAGRFRGGAAKTAVVASSFMGMISGSPLANVVTVGTFTIPLMKHAGYKPYVAGAVEALSSTGGNIMPPVMGAAAFIMADYLGLSYGAVAWAAILPAILYYVAVFMFCDLESLRQGMVSLPKSKLPDFYAVFRKGWYLVVPVVALVVLLILDYTPMMAAFWATVVAFILGVLMPANRLTLKKILDALEEGSKEVVPVAVACAAAGLIVGALGVTGLGVKFSSGLLQLSGGNSFVALVLTMVAALILGMGMPITAVYILLASLVPPALQKMGIPLLAGHMFIFYFSGIAGLTPPVALTAYAAAGLAGSDPNKTGWTAFWYGLVAYVVPYIFVYSPNLLMQGKAPEVAWAFVTAVVGTICFAMGLHDYLSAKFSTGWLSRALFLVGGLLLIKPGIYTDIAGLAAVGVAWILMKRAPARGAWSSAG